MQAHVLRGQMGTDRARCIRMPQFGQRRQILLAPAQRRKTWCFCCVFLSLQFFINSQAGQCEGILNTVKNTDTETPKQNREIVSSRCATVTAQSFFGVSSLNKPNQLPASFTQQLTVLGCCLHTKSDMKSNSFCPRKSSGSS